MLYDLNVPWASTQNPLEIQRTISFLAELGYDTLALNHIITGTLPPQITNPIPQTLPFKIPSNTTILRRCTLHLSDPTLNHRLPALCSAYDILALRPTNEKAFLAACLSIADHSIISLDLTQRYPFHFKPKPLMTAVNRGVRFEICYAQATLDDAGSRRNFISNCLGILRATKGRGLVISSEAKDVLGVRAPPDVINLMAVWGLGREKGMESLTTNPRGSVINDRIKRTSFRGVIDVIDGGDAKLSKDAQAGAKGNVKEAPSNRPNTGKKGKGKRLMDIKEVGEGEALQVSKRQAKKARLEAMRAEKGQPSPTSETTPEAPSEDSKGPDTFSTTKYKAIG